MDQKKGIELVKSGQSKEVSITIGNTTLKNAGRPSIVRFEQKVSYVYLVIDTSASMFGAKLVQAKQGCLNFAKDALSKNYLVGLISFNSVASHRLAPTDDIKETKIRIDSMNATGSTNMAEALKMARYHLDNPKSTQVIVVATDGRPDSVRDALEEAKKAKASNIDIITIGTDNASQDFLKKLATREELGSKVAREVFSQAISDASRLLPPSKS